MNPANSQEALSQLQQAQAQAQNPNDIVATQRQQLGVTGAQDTVTGLRGAINNTTKLLKQVAPSVMGRTGSSLVTNAQATKQISNEQAPIAQNLSEQGTQYNQANEDLNRLENQAEQAATGIYQGQQDKLSYAQNLYNNLFAREQATEQARQAEADRQEQIRQFNASLAAKGNSGGVAPVLPESQPAKAFSQQRSGGGYNFQDANGSAISAAKYAQLTGQDLMSVLLKMGQAGDKVAAQTYNQLKQKPGSVRPASIFWGT
jgi:hypothetical protein